MGAEKENSSSFTEADRYNERAILRSEFVYGHGWQAPGGADLFNVFSADLPKHMESVLVLGCGLGAEVIELRKVSEYSIFTDEPSEDRSDHGSVLAIRRHSNHFSGW